MTGSWILGKDHAVSGPTDIPACVGHHIVHNNSFLGAIGGLIGGLIVGIAVDYGCRYRGRGIGCAGCHRCCRCRGISWWICRWRSDGNWFPLGI
ncbi:hypothetical protein ACLB1M_05020 [Escherichia coli]